MLDKTSSTANGAADTEGRDERGDLGNLDAENPESATREPEPVGADVANGSEDGKTGEKGAQGAAAASGGELPAVRDKYLRLAAEYENYRKRSAKEREKIYSDARVEAITRLLPVYDNLERALKMECADEAFYKGVEMTMAQLTEILEGMGVRQIAAVGEPFDPNLHNAVMTVENPELGEKVVAEEFQKGFTLGERVIRHSTVVVAN